MKETAAQMHNNTVSYNSKICRSLVTNHSAILKKFTNLTLEITHNKVKEQLERAKLGIYTEEENVHKYPPFVSSCGKM